jgi:hypothetical protein
MGHVSASDKFTRRVDLLMLGVDLSASGGPS